jgi:hypothetical protein
MLQSFIYILLSFTQVANKNSMFLNKFQVQLYIYSYKVVSKF